MFPNAVRGDVLVASAAENTLNTDTSAMSPSHSLEGVDNMARSPWSPDDTRCLFQDHVDRITCNGCSSVLGPASDFFFFAKSNTDVQLGGED